MAEAIPLRSLTTLRIGGTPVVYHAPRTQGELQEALAECRRVGLPWRALGGGSNLLVDEGALPFAVIHVHGPGLAGVRRLDQRRIRVGAGTPTARLLAWCRAEGLGGLEFMAGLPGTVGGAVSCNAGAWKEAVCDHVRRLHLLTAEGRPVWRARERLRCAYRHTELQGAIVMEVELGLEPRQPRLIARRMRECLEARGQRHPRRRPSAGCIFRNPPGHSAGRLLDLCGLKGARVGAAEVSGRHANFILNSGGAVAGDVLALIRQMQEAVRRRFGIELQLEVRRWRAGTRAA